MSAYLSRQPDGSGWIIHKNPFAGVPITVETFYLTDKELQHVLMDYETIVESEEDE